MTSGQETEWVYSYTARARTGRVLLRWPRVARTRQHNGGWDRPPPSPLRRMQCRLVLGDAQTGSRRAVGRIKYWCGGSGGGGTRVGGGEPRKRFVRSPLHTHTRPVLAGQARAGRFYRSASSGLWCGAVHAAKVATYRPCRRRRRQTLLGNHRWPSRLTTYCAHGESSGRSTPSTERLSIT